MLISVFRENLPPTRFESVRLSCLHQACKSLQNVISRATSNADLLELLVCRPVHLNWMKIDYLQTIAIAVRSQVLQDTLKGYIDVVFSKTLGEVCEFIPLFPETRRRFYFHVRARFRGKNPKSVKVDELRMYKPSFAKRIALHVWKVGEGSLKITWCILAEEAYEAYLLTLRTPQELREDDFLKIGPWVAYHPRSVIQELKKCYG